MSLREANDSFDAAKLVLNEAKGGVDTIQGLRIALEEHLSEVETGLNDLPFNLIGQKITQICGLATASDRLVEHAGNELRQGLDGLGVADTEDGARVFEAVSQTRALLGNGNEDIPGVYRLCMSIDEDVQGMRRHITALLELLQGARQKTAELESAGSMIMGKSGSKFRRNERFAGTITAAVEAIDALRQ
jgi:hypothetical protein